MAHNSSLQFIVVQSEDCKEVKIKEQALWNTPDLPVQREDVAFALFWNNTQAQITGCDLSSPGSNTHQAVWTVPTLETGTYTFYMFVALRWHLGMSVHGSSIVYYNGQFWMNITLVSLTEAPGTTPNFWHVIDCTDFTHVFNYFHTVDNIPFLGGYFMSTYFMPCVPVQILNTGCNSYLVKITAAPPFTIPFVPVQPVPVLVLIWDITKTNILGCYYIDRFAGQTQININLPDINGVYIIEVGYGKVLSAVYDSVTSQLISYVLDNSCTFDIVLGLPNEYIVYSICEIEKCWKSLLNKMLCKPIDPCCVSCTPEEKEYIANFKYTLNMFNALWFNLMAYLEVEQGLYLHLHNVYTINGEFVNPERMKYVMQINDIIKMLNNIIQRCGDCNGALSNKEQCKEC